MLPLSPPPLATTPPPDPFGRAVDTRHPVDLKNLDRLDVFHRLDGLADDVRQVLDQVLVDGAAPRGVAAHVLRLVELGLALGLFLVTDRGRFRLGDFGERPLFDRFLSLPRRSTPTVGLPFGPGAAASISAIRLARSAASCSRAETTCSSVAASAFIAFATSVLATASSIDLLMTAISRSLSMISTSLLRSISNFSTNFRAAIRELVELAVNHDRRILDPAECRGLGDLDLLVLLDFELHDLFVSLEPLKIDIVSLEDRGFFLFGTGEFVDDTKMLVLLDRQRFDGLLDFDPARLDQPFALEFRLIDSGDVFGFSDRNFLPRSDLKFFDLRSFSIRRDFTSIRERCAGFPSAFEARWRAARCPSADRSRAAGSRSGR